MEKQVTVDKESFGLFVRKHRIAKGYTQQELSDLVGIQPKSISFIERGVTYPSPEHIFKIAYALDMSLDEYVFGFSRYNPPADNGEWKIAVEALPKSEKRVIMATMEALFRALVADKKSE